MGSKFPFVNNDLIACVNLYTDDYSPIRHKPLP